LLFVELGNKSNSFILLNSPAIGFLKLSTTFFPVSPIFLDKLSNPFFRTSNGFSPLNPAFIASNTVVTTVPICLNCKINMSLMLTTVAPISLKPSLNNRLLLYTSIKPLIKLNTPLFIKSNTFSLTSVNFLPKSPTLGSKFSIYVFIFWKLATKIPTPTIKSPIPVDANAILNNFIAPVDVPTTAV